MKRHAKVSLVLPTYNQANYLPYALDSIFAQTWSDFELIVVNDGSTDDTAQVLNEYQQKYTFITIYQENKKLPGALNTGFRRAGGKYLTWTSSDNNMLPMMLERLVKALDENPHVGLVYADWEEIDDDGNSNGIVTTLDYDRHLLMRTNFINACFMYRRECQESVGFYDEGQFLAEDWDYWLRISESFEMLRVPEVLYQYRVHAQSLTETMVKVQKKKAPDKKSALEKKLRRRRFDWYISKIKWELLRLRTGGDPHNLLQPE